MAGIQRLADRRDIIDDWHIPRLGRRYWWVVPKFEVNFLSFVSLSYIIYLEPVVDAGLERDVRWIVVFGTGGLGERT